MNLYFLSENLTNNLNVMLLDLFAVTAIFFAIWVIISKNPVYSVLNLIALFIVISCYLCSIDFYFIGLAYLLVYVGAVSILFLFILMLINIRISELLSVAKNSIPLVVYVSPIMTIIIGSALNFVNLLNYLDLYILNTPLWDHILSSYTHITSIGNILYTNFSI